MPENPHQDIERRLRAAAEARRQAAGGPFSLHPADRRMLQDQVRRTYGQSGREAGPAWLVWVLQHRSAIACYAALALVLAVFVPGMMLPAMKHARTRPPQAALATATSPAVSETVAAKAAPEPLRQDAPPPPAPAGRSADAYGWATDQGVAGPAVGPAPTTAAAQTRPTAAPAPRELESAAAQLTRARPPVADTTTAKSAPAVPAAVEVEPLSRFRVEQSGANVTVVDADGSVYRGLVIAEPMREQLDSIPAPNLRSATPPPGVGRGGGTGGGGAESRGFAAPMAESRSAATQPQPVLSFRVAGTNRTSQQTLQLQATLPRVAAGQGLTQVWVRGAATKLPADLSKVAKTDAANATAATGTNATLVGELQLGTKPPVPIQAQPAGR